MRKISEPFVVAPPTGARIRTRLAVTPDQHVALWEVGSFLGELSRRDLAARIRLGNVPVKDNQRRERKASLTPLASSRWAGAITRTSQDQYRLARDAQYRNICSLRAAIKRLDERLAAPVRGTIGSKRNRVRGYASAAERWEKHRRREILAARLAKAEKQHETGHVPVVRGGKQTINTRHHLEAAGLSLEQWTIRWGAARLFLTADGETGKPFGNETISVDPDTGTLRLKIPTALVDKHGTHITIPLHNIFPHRGEAWEARARDRQSIRYDITYNPTKNRWYVDASWGTPTRDDIPTVDDLLETKHLAVDLNTDHLAAWVVDPSGNPVGRPHRVEWDLTGSSTTRDGRVRAAITRLLDLADQFDCETVSIENLGFSDARQSGRETMGRGSRGKTFRRAVSGLPTAKFRDRLTAMAATRGIWIIAVDPAYTSKWGGQHWQTPLTHRTPRHAVSRHQAAAIVIGRRAHRLKARRRGGDPATHQRMRTRETTPQATPDTGGLDSWEGLVRLPRTPVRRARGQQGTTTRPLLKPFEEHTAGLPPATN